MSSYTFLSRATWGADPLEVQVGYAVPHEQFVGLVVHHTVIVMPDYDRDGYLNGDLDDVARYMRQLQRARPDLGDEVPYSFVFFEGADPDDIIIAEGRGYGRTGAHTVGYNSTRYGCSLAGDYTEHAPTPGQWAGIRSIGASLADPVGAQPTIGHRDVAATACPGNDAYPHLDLLQPPFTTLEDEVTPEQMAQIQQWFGDTQNLIKAHDANLKQYIGDTQNQINNEVEAKIDALTAKVDAAIARLGG